MSCSGVGSGLAIHASHLFVELNVESMGRGGEIRGSRLRSFYAPKGTYWRERGRLLAGVDGVVDLVMPTMVPVSGYTC